MTVHCGVVEEACGQMASSVPKPGVTSGTPAGGAESGVSRAVNVIACETKVTPRDVLHHPLQVYRYAVYRYSLRQDVEGLAADSAAGQFASRVRSQTSWFLTNSGSPIRLRRGKPCLVGGGHLIVGSA